MDVAAYYIALATILAFPAVCLFWLLVHPFARRWRRVGPVATYSSLLLLMLLCAAAIYLVRAPLLAVRFGVKTPLVVAAVFPFLVSLYIGILRSRHFRVSTLLGLPELSAGRGPGTLVTSGIFARIRHPRYLEGGLALMAIALFTNYLAMYILLVAYVPLILLVTILEERELRERFGPAYERYCREVPRFLPRMETAGGSGSEGTPGRILNSRGLRVILAAAGLCCTALAVLGIFLPLLPTVPLLLLAAACFARSSERFHNWLLEHPHLGPMIRGYLDGQGMPLRAKVTAIGLIWVSIPLSVLFFIRLFWVKVFLIAIGLCVTVYLLRLPVCEGGEE